jgi:HSP20 family protein
MALIPYEPFRQLENVRREFDRFFTNDIPALKTGLSQYFFGNPNIDLYETETEIIASCDLPGLEKNEDVNIDIDNNLLSISGTINRTAEIKEEHLHRRERFYGRFHRTISLPTPVDAEGAKATYKNGVLEIRMPKLESDTKKRIDIDFH